MPPRRYKMTIAYRGTRYHGWQRQLPTSTWKGETPAPGEGIPTIQETVSTELGKLIGHPVEVIGSSRTDAGVHAKGQVAHFDTDGPKIPPYGLMLALNHRLPPDILVKRIEKAPDGFDAIASTVSKRYQFAIWATELRNPLIHDLVWHRWRPLDFDAMAAAAPHFVGTHDFTSFVRPCTWKPNAVRTIFSCDVSHRGPMLVIGIEGSGFLWNMVRIIVGTIVEVGLKLYVPEDIPRMLAALDRRAAGSTAPPHGLYLQWVKFGPTSQTVTPEE